MPKIKIDDNMRIYYRVFRYESEYRTKNESAISSEYIAENGDEVFVNIPLKDVEGIKVIYTDEDQCIEENVPTMVMLPGGPGFLDHSMYIDFWAKLSGRIQVVILDQRGNGRSDRGDPAQWTLNVCAADIVKFCNALNIEKPLVAGVSWGGYVALRYAIDFPDHPGALILMHTEAKVSSEARQEAFAEKARTFGYNEEEIAEIKKVVQIYDEIPNAPGARENFLKKCWGKFYAKNPYTQQDFEKCVTNIPMRQAFAINENLQFDFRPELNKIQCKVWYVAADQDPGHPYQYAEETAKKIPNAEFLLMKGIGAPVYRDDPENVKKLTEAAIEKMRSSLSTKPAV